MPATLSGPPRNPSTGAIYQPPRPVGNSSAPTSRPGASAAVPIGSMLSHPGGTIGVSTPGGTVSGGGSISGGITVPGGSVVGSTGAGYGNNVGSGDLLGRLAGVSWISAAEIVVLVIAAYYIGTRVVLPRLSGKRKRG